MQKEIQEAINKNLPQEVGAILQERLKKADEDAIRIESLENSIKVLDDKNKHLSNENSILNNLKIKQDTLNKREQELNLKEEIVKLKETHSSERISELRNVVHAVFRNPTYTTSRNLYQNKDNYDQNGCIQPMNSNETETIEKTQE